MQPGADLFAAYGAQEFGDWRQRMRAQLRAGPPDERVVLIAFRHLPPVYPPICPNCMAPAAGQLKLERRFSLEVADSEGSRQSSYEVDEFTIPICAPCLQRHRAELKPHGPWAPVQRLLGHSGQGVGGLTIFCVGLFFCKIALERFDYVPLLIGSVPLLIGFAMLRSNWKQNRHVMVPSETSVSLSVETTPGLGLEGELYWRAFRFRLPRYAALFQQANAREIWDPNGAEAQAARAERRASTRRTNWIIGTIVVLFLLWALWDEYLKPLLER